MPDDGLDGKIPKQRVWKACVPCRKKKIKCNGQEPCEMCSQRKEECIYAETRDRAANSRQYVAHLESRLAQVEASLTRLADAGVSLPPGLSNSPGYPGSIPVVPPPNRNDMMDSTNGSGYNDLSQHDIELSAYLAEQEPIASTSKSVHYGASYTSEKVVGSPTAFAWVTESDAYASPNASESTGSGVGVASNEGELEELTRDFSHIAVDRRGELRFMGGGTIGILVESLGTIKPRDGHAPPELPFLHPTVPLSSGGRSDAAWLPRATDFGFPPRDVLLRLVDTYFRRIHPLFPILNRAAFQRRLLSDTAQSDTAFAALVFAVAAAASMLVPGYGTSASTAVGNEWLERASILHYRCSRETSLTHVQCLGIMGSYLAAINDLPAAWLVTGQAMRTAQDLGLHRSTVRLSLTPSEMQERRRIFWCIYGQDRGISYALGRSMGIDDPDVDVELPFDMDDEDLATCTRVSDVHPNGKPNLMSGFIAITQMHIIARRSKRNHRALDRLPDTSDPAHGETINRLSLPIETAMTRWTRNLPACIRDATEDDPDPTYWMQSVLAYSQYHTTRMNAFRPTISGARTLRCFGLDDVDTSYAAAYFARVRASAASAAGLGTVIRRAIAPSHELAFAVEQTLLAGVILARCLPLCKEPRVAEETAAAARTCVASLAALEAWPGAARCREILDDLVTQVVSADQAARLILPMASPSSRRKRPAEEAFTAERSASSAKASLALWDDVGISDGSSTPSASSASGSTGQSGLRQPGGGLSMIGGSGARTEKSAKHARRESAKPTSIPIPIPIPTGSTSSMFDDSSADIFGNSAGNPFSFGFTSPALETPSSFSYALPTPTATSTTQAGSAPDSTAPGGSAGLPALDLTNFPFPGLSFLSEYAAPQGDPQMTWDSPSWLS